MTDYKETSSLTIYTTWNRITKAAAAIGGHHGMKALPDDVPARLVPLVVGEGIKIPGWLEVEIQDHTGNYGACYYDGNGQATTLAAWVPNLSVNADREGIALIEDILTYLDGQGKTSF